MGWELGDGRPVAVALAELAQGLGVTGASVVPHRDRRDIAELPTSRGRQVRELAGPQSPSSRRYGPGISGSGGPEGSRGLAGHRSSRPSGPGPNSLPATLTSGVLPRLDQVRPLPDFRSCPASSSETVHAPRSRAVLLPVTTAPSATRPPPVHRARQPGARGPAAPAQPMQQTRHPTRGTPVAEQAMDQLRDPRQGPAPILRPAVHRRPASSPACSRSARASPSRHEKSPGPLEARAALPPSRQAACQAYADLRDTRNLRATPGGRAPRSNIPTASKRTASRFARPAAVSPPPSTYLMTRM